MTGLALACAQAGAQTATAGEAAGRVIGKLGQAVAETPIRSAATTRSRVFSTTRRFQYLIVNPTRHEGWLAVKLQNGRQGYILADKVARLPYDVRMDAPAPTAPPRGNAASRTGTSGRPAVDEMLQYSFRYVGTPYRWGGNSLSNGIDCSGFVQQLFGKVGVDLPRTAAQQALVGTAVERIEHLRPGDRLYFWEHRRNKIGHTGIFLGFQGDGRAYFIHSSSGRRGVQTDDLANPKWRNLLVAARRD